MSARPALRALARRCGILDAYTDILEHRVRETRDDVREAILVAMGFDATTEATCARELAAAFDTTNSEDFDTPVEALKPCTDIADVFGDRRAFGVMANLYSVRGTQSEGIGDLADLADLAAWCGRIGGAFVGVNPLHAGRKDGDEVSPYSPITRLFPDPIYVRIRDVPEFATSPEAQRLHDAAGLDTLDRRDRIGYAEVRDRKRALLERLAAAFQELPPEHERRRAFESFTARDDPELSDFATFVALEAAHGRTFREWPHGLANPKDTGIDAERKRLATAIDACRFAQFELDRQLACAATRAHAAGLALGLYTDLAVGSVDDGFDAWAYGDLTVPGIQIGAPPDDFQREGQGWALTPLHPHRLVEERGRRYWRRLLRGAMRHAGALRIDHVMGLFRQFWIPDGCSPKDGAYVTLPWPALLSILAEESRAANAVVIGEDLGTVPDGLPERLRRCRILSSRVLLFERDDEGFLPADRYPTHALATANTHDLPTLRGYLEGVDIEQRSAAGGFPDETDRRVAHDRRRRDIALLRARIAGHESTDDAAEFVRDVHAFLDRTPSVLVGLSLDDLTNEAEGVNLPGIPMARHASWSRRMHRSIETLDDDAHVRQALTGIRARRGSDGPTAAPDRPHKSD